MFAHARRIAVAGTCCALALATLDARAQEPDASGIEHRFGGALSFTPFSFTSGDAPFDEAVGDTLLAGASVEYGLRLFRHGQIGAAARWVYAHRRSGDDSGPYAHGFELPGLLTVLFPAGRRVELLAGAGAGWSMLWLIDQSAAGPATVRAMGPTFEGRGGIAYKIGKSADATTEVGFTAAMLQADHDALGDVLQIAVPVRIGVRGRW